MLGKTWFVMALAVLAAGRAVHQPRAEANLPTIKDSLEVLIRELGTLSSRIKAITAQNVDSQLGVINTELKRIANVGSQQAQKLKASGAIEMTEVTGVVSQLSSWMDVLTRTVSAIFTGVQDIAAKAPIVQKSGKADRLAEGFTSMKKFLKDIFAASISQVPSALFSTLKSFSPNMPTPNDPQFTAAINPALDNIMDQLLGYLKGTVTSFTIPPSLTSLVPANLASLIPANLSSLIPANLSSLIPANLSSLIPANLASLIPANLASLIPGSAPKPA